MNDDEKNLMTVFSAALDCGSADERQAYLDRACAGDPALRHRVEALLRAHERAGGFLGALGPEITVGREPSAESSPAADPVAGTIVAGRYKLLERIGEGGMGEVHLAQQTEPIRRLVAVKLVKPGMDSRQVLARFEAERQALAMMDHANIAKVLDAGAAENGRPYFVMELVKGTPITRYCDENRLTPRERLELFLPVCQAVQHAHQKGVIHRDLKPSNVLVAPYDGKPVVKVIDFGVAKAVGQPLTDRTLVTGLGAVVGTPEYMSPEQAELNNLDIDTRSDIYALGVLLYELLTGTTPLTRKRVKEAVLLEILRVIREEEPPRPSARLSTTDELPSIAAVRGVEPARLSRLVRGELDWIVMKALEKDRNRRYDTANALASDVRRYLTDEPVQACPPSAWYRFRKLARRNRPALVTASVVAASLVAVAVLSVLYADRQRRFAIDKAEAARKISDLDGNLKTSLAESNRLLAIRNYERGQAACEKGEIGPGMLWMIESWRSAVDAADLAWQHAARANLAAWRPHYPRLKAVLSNTAPVVDAAFSPDSRTVISRSMDGTTQLWDAASGKPIGPPLQGGQWSHMAFSPDSKTMLTASEQGHTAQLWDAATGLPRGLPLRLPPQVHILATPIQPDGKIVLVGTEENAGNVARLWDGATGQPIGLPLAHLGQVHRAVFSPDGRIILTASEDGTAQRWDATTRQPIGLPLKRPGRFRSVAFGLDGQTIVTLGSDGTALLWDAVTGHPLGPPMRDESRVRAVALSPDGKTVLTGYQDKEARLWDAATGQLIGLLAHQGGITPVAFSPDGQTILTGSLDGTVRLWDADPGQPVGQVLEIPSTDAFRAESWLSPDGKVLTSTPREPRPRYYQLWNATTRQPIARLPQPGGTQGVRFSPDGKLLLTIAADQTARLWDATTGAALGATFPLPCPVMPEGDPGVLSPDGKTFLFVGKDQSVWACDVATGSVRGRTPALGGWAYGFECSPDGKTFFTGLDNGEVRLWDAATLTPLGDPIRNPGGISTGLFSPDGQSLLITCEDGSVRLWDLATRKLRIPPLWHQAWVSGRAFSPDGKTIATGSYDKTAHLWDIATGQPIGPALRHPSPVGVAFSGDGKTLYTQSTVLRLFPIPPDLPDEPERMAAWVEVITGLRLDKQRGLIEVLDNAAWLDRRERLRQLGGPPETGPDQRLDPILFGPDPTARAKRFQERKQWDAAEAALDEAMRARPFNISIMLERGDLGAQRGLWSQAAAYYAAKVRQYPEVARLHYLHVLSLLTLGDEAGLRQACSDLLDRFGSSTGHHIANDVAWDCLLAPGAVANRAAPVRLAQFAVNDAPEAEKPDFLNTLGAALYRAGRSQEALRRLEEGIRKRGGESLPQDWVFLAMVHHQLGHDTEARRWLDRLRAHRPNENPSAFWNELEIRLLRREAEAVILYDPAFPSDPFAP